MDFTKILTSDIGVDEYLKQYNNKLKAADSIIICGMGGFSRFAFFYLESIGFLDKIKGIRDMRLISKNEKEYNGYPVISDQQVKEASKKEIYICTPKKVDAYLGCVKDLELLGVEKDRIFPAIDGFFFLKKSILEKRRLNVNEVKMYNNEFQKAYELLSDELSKTVFESMINYKLTGNIKYLLPVTRSYSQHDFDKEFFVPEKHKRFVDLGAYDGDTAKAYIAKVDNKYEQIFCFEPDPDNFGKLKQWKDNSNSRNVNIFCIGVGSKKETVTFSASGTVGSNISADGNISIEVDTVDHILNGEQVDYVKFDVEGAEYDALLGMRDTIKKYKPTLCVSCYHLKTDFYKLPFLIKELCPDYKLYLRQYLLRYTSTELYAVATE